MVYTIPDILLLQIKTNQEGAEKPPVTYAYRLARSNGGIAGVVRREKVTQIDHWMCPSRIECLDRKGGC